MTSDIIVNAVIKHGSKTEMRHEKLAFYEFLLSVFILFDNVLIVHCQSIIAITTGNRVKYYMIHVLHILKAFN